MQQHPHYARCLLTLGTQAVAVEIFDGTTRVGRAQIYRRQFGPVRAFWLPRGPVWQGDQPPGFRRCALRALRRSIDGRGLWLVSPDTENGPDGMALRLTRRLRVAETDLAGDQAARRAVLHPRWRNHLNRAERAGLEIEARALRPDDATLLRNELAQRHSRRYIALPPAFTDSWAAEMPTASRLFIARQGKIPIAFMLFLLHAPVASYHLGWTGPEGRQVAAHALLLWHASAWLAGEGYRRLDLGTLDATNPGLSEFKLRSGAIARDLGATRLLLHV